jgi:hypothetical protein
MSVLGDMHVDKLFFLEMDRAYILDIYFFSFFFFQILQRNYEFCRT